MPICKTYSSTIFSKTLYTSMPFTLIHSNNWGPSKVTQCMENGGLWHLLMIIQDSLGYISFEINQRFFKCSKISTIGSKPNFRKIFLSYELTMGENIFNLSWEIIYCIRELFTKARVLTPHNKMVSQKERIDIYWMWIMLLRLQWMFTNICGGMSF